MNKINLAVIFGGASTEHEVSIKSAFNIISVLDKEKYNILCVYITKSGEWFLYDGAINNLLNVNIENVGYRVTLSPSTYEKGLIKFHNNKYSVLPVDLALPIIHGANGEDGSIQGLFQLAGIKFVGCGVLASSVSFDKEYTKIVVENLGIKQVKSVIVKNSENFENDIKNIESKLKYPIFVKPSKAGSSVGVSKVTNKEELLKGLIEANKFDTTIIVEEGYKIREIECAVLGNKNPKASVLGEVIADGTFYGYDEKYNNPNSKTLFVEDLSVEQVEYIKNSAIKIFKALNCTGLSRVDFFLDVDTNEIYFNEINTMPGFTNISMYPMLWEKSGVKYNELLDTLIALGLGAELSTELENEQ